MRMGTAHVLRRTTAVALMFVLPASIGTGCSNCEARCIGPQAQVVVDNDIAEVTVCDSSGTCTEQAFDEAGGSIVSRSFTISAVEADDGIPLTVTGTTRTGQTLGPVQLLARPSKGDCGCSDPAQVFVDTTGANLPNG